MTEVEMRHSLISVEEAAKAYQDSINIDKFILSFNNAVKAGNDFSIIIENLLQRKMFIKILIAAGWKYDVITEFTLKIYVQSSIMDKINQDQS